MLLSDVLSQIGPGSEPARRLARQRWDSCAKPLGSLGLLEEALVQIAALTGRADVSISPRTLLVLCADNGVVAQGVAQAPSSVTATVARNLARGVSTVCLMAETAKCRVLPVDLGILDFPPTPGVLSRRVRNGTGDIALQPAMTRRQALAAILTGVQLVREQQEQGARLLAVGEMGIGNTTTASAVSSVLLNLPPKTVTGRGAGLSDEGLARKITVIQRAIAQRRPDPSDPVDVLSKVGGLDIAAMCGVFLGGALYRLPVLMDGMISAAAALCALRLCPHARWAMLASHVSAEPAGARLLEALSLSPLIAAHMRLGEGSGAVAAIPLLDMACAVYRQGLRFDQCGIEPYRPLGGFGEGERA